MRLPEQFDDLLLDALEEGDLVRAVDRIRDAIEHGASVAQIIDDLVAPVLVEIGRRWEANEWTTDQERSATSTIDAALAAIETRIWPQPASTGRPVVVACVDGELHSLAARLAVLRLRADGRHVLFLGPSLSVPDIVHHLLLSDAAVLGLSCTMSANLIATRRSAEAAHEIGVPVFVGGAAFDVAGRRARRIGADVVAAVDSVDAFLDHPTLGRFEVHKRVEASRREAIDLDFSTAAVVDAAMAELALRHPRTAHPDGHVIESIRERLTWLVRSAAAALDVCDPTLLTEVVAWSDVVLEARGRADVVPVVLDSIERALKPSFPQTSRLVRQVARAVTLSSTASAPS